jgi:hypothetical protein
MKMSRTIFFATPTSFLLHTTAEIVFVDKNIKLIIRKNSC